MQLNINDNKTVSDLQDKFNECYPFLKIEFYDERHKWHRGSAEANKITPDTKIQGIRKNHNNGILEIKSWNKTGTVEKQFRDIFGLNVQIFFIKNNEWVQSVAADDLTLGNLMQHFTGVKKALDE